MRSEFRRWVPALLPERRRDQQDDDHADQPRATQCPPRDEPYARDQNDQLYARELHGIPPSSRELTLIGLPSIQRRRHRRRSCFINWALHLLDIAHAEIPHN